jgi:phosphonoacetate hydrolase
VTNANNASVCCGAWPAEHGISGNSYVDRRTGREEYMEDGALLRAPTLFERAAAAGVRSALLSCKKKTVPLLSRGAEIAMTAESPGAAWVERLGPAPPIYSREINYWLLRAAADVLARRPDVGCLYVHTTDYPMHTWAPDAAESREHLARVDALLGELAHAAPDAAFLVTADHGLGAKTRCWDLARALAARGLPVRIAISAERDRYLQHHKGYGGTGWVYLRAASDAGRAAELLHGLDGVEAVLTRDEAVRRFRLPPDRVGDLMVLGDAVTVFGELAEADGERETLPAGYRSHGSLREAAAVPLVIHNHDGPLGDAASYTHNLHLTRALFPTPRGA